MAESNIIDIMYDLLASNDIPAELIDKAEWDAEAEKWNALTDLTPIITGRGWKREESWAV